MRLLSLLLFTGVLGVGLAQTPAPTTLSEAEVTRLVAGARSEVMLEFGLFDDKAIAEGLRLATLERGAKAFVLVRGDTVESGPSYTPWASLLPNTGARLLAFTRGDYLVVDRRVAVIREERMGLPVYRLEESPAKVAALVRQFVEAFAVARPYRIDGLVERRVARWR